jgi:hypothetical protein
MSDKKTSLPLDLLPTVDEIFHRLMYELDKRPTTETGFEKILRVVAQQHRMLFELARDLRSSIKTGMVVVGGMNRIIDRVEAIEQTMPQGWVRQGSEL